MKYWFVNIETANGERTSYSKSVHATKGTKKFDGENHARTFFGEVGERWDDGSDWYSFNGGCIACRLVRCEEITKKEYETLEKYL